jgi:hypothetical protein
MRWRRKIKIGPRIGDLRIRKAFAFLPTRIGFFMVWLESYYSLEKCLHVYGGFLGAKWEREHPAFDLDSATQYLESHYGSYAFIKSKGLYRDSLTVEGQSPWYSDQKPQA